MDVAFADLDFPALDAAEFEALVLWVPPEERPLRGLAGLCDWRLCGTLSRILSEGWYSAGPGEVLLVPSGGRLAARRLFAFGLGEPAGRQGQIERLLPRALSALSRARVESAAFAVPWPGLDLSTSLSLWARSAPGGPARQLLLGPAEAIGRWLAENRGRVAGLAAG